MIIEPLSPANLDQAVSMILALWPDTSFIEEQQNCERITQSGTEEILLAKIQNEYAGFIYLNLRSEYVEGTSSSPVLYLEGIYVKPAFRSQGIGKQLVERGAAWGRTKGAREFASDVEIHNENSIAFHERIGFREVNRVACFVQKIPHDDS